jgi:peptide/nickel transport system substrate-binding protein
MGFLLTAILLTCFVGQSNISVNKVLGGQISLPTPREETFVLNSWLSVSNNQNPLLWPYCSYLALCQVMAEFFWYFNYASGEIIYWLATGFEYSNDYMTFTIHLRDGVKWNDGEPFTSEDVKFTFDLVRSNEMLVNSQWVNEWIESVSTPDELNVVLNLKKPNPRVHITLRAQNWGELVIVPRHIWENVENPELADVFGRGDNPVPCVFTGPYMLDQLLEDQGMLVFKRNEDYWGKTVMGVLPEPKYVIYRNGQSPDIEYYEVVSGDTYDGQWFELLPTDLLLAALQVPKNNLTISEYVDPMLMALLPNCGKYPLSLPEVRWALSYALDRETLCASYPTYPGIESVEYPWPSWGSGENYAYADIFNEYKIEYNLTKAAEILDSLNFIDRNGDGIRETPNGTMLSWEVIADDVYAPMFAGKVIGDLAQIGIKFEVITMAESVLNSRITVGDFDLMFWGWEPTVFVFSGDITEFFEYYRGIHYAPIGESLAESYPARATSQRFKNDELDALVDQMLAISPVDPQMVDLAHDAIEIFMEQLPAIPAVQTVRLEVFNTKYWTGQPTEDNYYVFTAPWDPLYKFILNNVRSTGAKPAISYAYVWMTDVVEAFTGADQRTYGPFSEGDYAQLPLEDAEALVADGLASFEASIPGLTELLTAISGVNEGIASNSENIDAMQTSVAALVDTVAAQSSQITMLLAGVAIDTILVLVLLVLILIRKK